MSIHKTAIIHDNVEIGSNVSIGEYSIIYPGTLIKNNVKIGSHNSIGTKPESKFNKSQSNLTIDENTVVTDFVSINNGSTAETYIGKNCFIMNHSYIAHDVKIMDNSIITSGVRILGFVIIGKEVYLGANCTVHQNSLIGDLALIGANSFLKGEAYSGLVYVGIPAIPKKINEVGIERSSINNAEIQKILENARKVLT